MTDLFLEILNLSISAGWLVLAVLVLRLLLKKAPKWVNVLLWAIVALRLVLPVTLESEISLIPSSQTVSPEIMMTPKPIIDTGIPVINDAVNPVISQSFAPQPLASANPLQILLPVAANLWVLGIIIMLLYTLITYLRLRIKVRAAVRVRDNIYQTEKIASPFVLGIIKPRIYLPFSMRQQDMDYVIAHEKAHIRRKDHWWKPLGFLVLSVYWFNPLLWVGYILLCRDIELACDEKVVKKLEIAQRADYSQALLNSSVNRKMIAACPLAFGEVGVKARVKSVLNYKKPAFWIILVALIACIAVAVCFLTDPLQPKYMLGVRLEEEYPATGTSNSYWSFYKLEKAEGIEIPFVYNAKLQILEATEDAALVNFVSNTGAQSPKLQVKKGEPTETSLFDSDNKKIQFFVVDVNSVKDQGKVQHWFGDYAKILPSPTEPVQLPGLPEVTVQLVESGYQQTVVFKNGQNAREIEIDHTLLVTYFCDLNDDGVAELCMLVNRGSGFVDRYVAVYNYKLDELYTVENRCVYDYTLIEEDGELILKQSDYDTWNIVAQGPLKILEIPETDDATLIMNPVDLLIDPVLTPGEERLPVGDYVLGELISGKADGAADYYANRVKRFGVREENVVLYQSEKNTEYKEQWKWINTAQIGKLLYFKDDEFYRQAIKKGYLYQNVANIYHLFKDGDKMYIGFQYFDYVDEQYKLNVYEFLPAPPIEQTHNLCIKTLDPTDWGATQICDMLTTSSLALHTYWPLNMQILEITADSVKLSFDRSMSCDGNTVNHILLSPGEIISVSDPEENGRSYTFFLMEKPDTNQQDNIEVWFEDRTIDMEISKVTLPELPGVVFEPHSMHLGDGIVIMDGGWRIKSILENTSIYGCVTSAYFCDMTGDGVPEICAAVSDGTNFVIHHVVVYDPVEEKAYTMEDATRFDYHLKESDGKLVVVKTLFGSDKPLACGQLRLVKNPQDGEWMLAFLVE